MLYVIQTKYRCEWRFFTAGGGGSGCLVEEIVSRLANRNKTNRSDHKRLRVRAVRSELAELGAAAPVALRRKICPLPFREWSALREYAHSPSESGPRCRNMPSSLP
eukprot:4859463-Pyramimonas_sp.AAC.3